MSQEGKQPPAYTYIPLSSTGQIRVLEILPTHGRIQCRIRNIHHSDSGYCALSYVWGDPATPHQAAIVDDTGTLLGDIPLTQNLANAIQDIRSTSVSDRLFWIDQICINQRDLEEKGQQVAMMGEIFESADCVITYAGPVASGEEQENGMRLLNRLREVFPLNHEVFEFLATAKKLHIADQNLRKGWQNLLPQDLHIQKKWTDEELWQQYVEQGWKWLLEVCLGEWTERLWIVQEQMLNNKGYILQGASLYEWESLIGIFMLFESSILPYEYFILFYSGRDDDTGRFLYSLHHIWKTRRSMRMPHDRRHTFDDFLRNLSSFYHLKCKDHRDRVYALLSISADVDLKSNTAGITRPDYSDEMTPTALSRVLSICLITREGFLEHVPNRRILNIACGLRHSAKLPSWCINIDLPYSYKKPDLIPAGQWAPHPKMQLTTWPSLLNDQSTLVVRGRVVDTISEASRVHVHPSSWGKALHPILTFYQEIIDVYMFGPEITVEKTAMLCRALAPYGRDLPPHEVLTEEQHWTFILLHSFRNYVRGFLKSLGAKHYHKTLETDISDPFVEKLNRTIAALSALLPPGYGANATAATRHEREMAWLRFKDDETISGRCFCVSHAGRFCNVMHQAQEGDAVLALEGYDRLFVVRSVGGERFQLIGDAYVDGLMRGEAYEGLDPNIVDYDIALV